VYLLCCLRLRGRGISCLWWPRQGTQEKELRKLLYHHNSPESKQQKEYF